MSNTRPDSELREIRFSPSTAPTINVADSPITATNNVKITAVEPQEFAKSVGMKRWVEASLMVDSDFKKLEKDPFGLPVLTKEQFVKFKKTAAECLNKFVICKMGPYGHGVFTQRKIAKNTFIGFYTGHFKYESNAQIDQLKLEYGFAQSGPHGRGFSLDASEYGNITRFMQHLFERDKSDPSETCLADYKFTAPAHISNVAAANVREGAFLYQGYLINSFITNRDIEPYEQIGYSYGFSYWLNSGKIPRLFANDGSLIPLELYQVRKPIMRFYYEEDNEIRKVDRRIGVEVAEEQVQRNEGAILPRITQNGRDLIVEPSDFKEALETYRGSPFLIISLFRKAGGGNDVKTQPLPTQQPTNSRTQRPSTDVQTQATAGGGATAATLPAEPASLRPTNR